MANETKIGIDVQASTAAAKAALSSLAAGTREVTTAGDEAGKSQKKLGQQVNETKARQIEATEAIRRAKAAQAEHNLTVQAFGPKSAEAARSAKALADANQEAKRSADKAAQALEGTAKAATEAAKAEGDKLSPATKRLANQLQDMGKSADATAGELRRLDLSITATSKAADKGSKSMAGFLGSFAGNLASSAVGAIAGHFKDAAGWVLETGASYETLRISLETITGSSAKAATEFERLQAFAAATPFGVAEVTDAYIKLANRGIQPTDRAMTAFGNHASAMGKSLDDMVEAVADAVTGENERLKEFGIVGKLAGDQVQYTFRGVTTSVKRDAASIQEYLTKIGEANFAGGMEKQSQSLAGKWSTLVDQASSLADSLVQGLAPALKEVMDSFTVGGDGAKDFARSLGQDIGDAVKVLAAVLHAMMKVLHGVAAGWHAVSSAVKDSVQIVSLAEDQARKFRGEMGLMEERLIDSTMALKGQREGMTDWLAATTLSTEAQIQLNEAILAGQKIAFGKSIEDAREAAEAQRRAREDMVRLEDMTKKKENAAKRMKEAELSVLNAKDLSPSEKKRRNELQKELDVPTPAKGKKGKKDKGAGERDVMDFDADVATYEAKLAKEIREADVKSQEEAYERAAQLQDRKLERMDREIELLEAQGIAETQRVDAVFFTIEAESEAERQRQAMMDYRMRREIQYAQWQVRNARTEKQREEAQTHLQAVHHKKRLADAEKAQAAENLHQANRAKVFEGVRTHVLGVGEAVVQGIKAQQEGEKGAIAALTSEYLKGVAIRMAIKGAEETVLGVAALAGIVTAGLAPPHFAAAGMAFAAAAAAGGGAAIASGVADARGYGSEKKADTKGGDGITPGSSSGKGGGGIDRGGSRPSQGAGDDDGVPTSYVERSNFHKRNTPTTAPKEAGGTVINYTFPGMQVMGGTQEQVGVAMKRLLDKAQQSAGKTR